MTTFKDFSTQRRGQCSQVQQFSGRQAFTTASGSRCQECLIPKAAESGERQPIHSSMIADLPLLDVFRSRTRSTGCPLLRLHLFARSAVLPALHILVRRKVPAWGIQRTVTVFHWRETGIMADIRIPDLSCHLGRMSYYA
jgi:hypothetical protein